MEPRNFSEEIFEIMVREMDDIGVFIVKKQCFENGIMYDYITWEDVPKLSRAISEVMLNFGEDKANRILKEMLALVDLEALVEKEADPLTKAKMLSQLGDSSAIVGDLKKALKYYEKARKIAEGIEPAVAEIDNRIKLIGDRMKA